jgi:hypothetical protein
MNEVLIYLLGTFVCIVLFRIPNFFGLVFFYQGILILGMTSICIGLMLLRMKRSIHDSLLFVLAFFCFNLVIFTHLPVTADRSVSVFLLGYMSKHQAVTPFQLREAVVDIYVDKNQALEKRLNEQIQTGTIVQRGDTYMLTPRGASLVSFYGMIAGLFGIDKTNLSGF